LPGDEKYGKYKNSTVQTIPSPKAEPFKRWLAKVGYEKNYLPRSRKDKSLGEA
jgi:hypothetical protein